ncbi:hypothetical protein [Micromonospora parva]|uniref:hypothetical protein n=1 Tax=Micromonospora parva TaxID=1464048 RepID=UPI0033FFCAB7
MTKQQDEPLAEGDAAALCGPLRLEYLADKPHGALTDLPRSGRPSARPLLESPIVQLGAASACLTNSSTA